MDSTVARAHQHAAGARRRGDLQAEPPGGTGTEPADHGLGRSRGGLTTKVHLACEQDQQPLSVVITAGQRGLWCLHGRDAGLVMVAPRHREGW